jgi:hypothetical protein
MSGTRLIWSNFRLAIDHNALGQVLRAAGESVPSKISSVPRFRNDLITYHIIRDTVISVKFRPSVPRRKLEVRADIWAGFVNPLPLALILQEDVG